MQKTKFVNFVTNLKKKLQLSLYFIFMLVVCGCNDSANMHALLIKNYPSQFEYIKYSNGQAGQATIVKQGDYLYDQLHLLILDENVKWKSSFTTYAPQNLLYSEKMNVNFIDKLVIINFSPNDKKWIQIVGDSEKPIIKAETEKYPLTTSK